jgi:hypothetical protein
MSRTALLLSVPAALACIGCGAAPRMLVTGPLAQVAAHELTARPSLVSGNEFVVEPYRGVGFHDSWTPEEVQLFAERFSDFGGEYAFAYTLTHQGTPVRAVGCRGNATLDQVDMAGRVWSYAIRCSIMPADRSGERAWVQVDLYADGGELGWWDGDDGTSGGEAPVEGAEEAAAPREDSVWQVQTVLMTETGQGRQEPLGYQFVAAEGPFAAVQVGDGSSRVWLDGQADEDLRHDAAAASIALIQGRVWSATHLRTTGRN